MDQINEYDTFHNMGRGVKHPRNHQHIRAHFVFLSNMASITSLNWLLVDIWLRLVQETDFIPVLLPLYPSAFTCSLQSSTIAADVGNANLIHFTKEKLFIIAGRKFITLVPNLEIADWVSSSLLRPSINFEVCAQEPARWHEFFTDTLMDMGFYPCKANPDVMMKDCVTHYQLIWGYMDDWAFVGVMQHTNFFFQELSHCG
jgi:hypothetical protein